MAILTHLHFNLDDGETVALILYICLKSQDVLFICSVDSIVLMLICERKINVMSKMI